MSASSALKIMCEGLRSNVDAITLSWVQRVKHSKRIESDERLTLSQLIDHIPEMIEEICELLTQDEGFDFEKLRAARKHGFMRSVEGYALNELLLELEILRDCVFSFIADYITDKRIAGHEAVRALRQINRYFSDDVLFVVEYYLRHGGLRPRSE